MFLHERAGRTPPRTPRPSAAELKAAASRLAAPSRPRANGAACRCADAEPAWWITAETRRTPEQQAVHREQLAQVEAALAALPPQTRLAVEMHRFGGHSLQEIATRLGVSVPTAHRLVGTAADIFVQAQFPLHSGRILGLPGRILVSLMELVVAALAVTGVLVWRRKRLARAAALRKQPAGRAPFSAAPQRGAGRAR